MKVTFTKNYIILPINLQARDKKICFYDGETLLFDLDVNLDCISPQAQMYYDVRRFKGKTLNVRVSPGIDFECQQTDTVPPGEKVLRPKTHFSAEYGYNNDPNGMIFYEGQYHLFYQYNPVGTKWGNMHWGHAVSRDMFHWEDRGIALFPDDMGMMFSGSAIEDTNNVLGLNTDAHNALVLFYSAAGDITALSKGQPYTQCLAYSVDGGVTFEKHPANPIIQNIGYQNRDPKVIWSEKLQKFVMALFRGEKDNTYCLFTSDDLLHWELTEELTSADRECPDFFFFGDTWVMLCAGDKYTVGTFDGKKFQHNPVWKQLGSGLLYASQTFSGLPDDRRVRICLNRSRGTSCDRGNSMTLPHEITLKGDELRALPVPEIEQLYETVIEDNDITTKNYRMPLENSAYDIEFRLRAEQPVAFTAFGVTVNMDVADNTVSMNGKSAPLNCENGEISVRIIIDTTTFEIFTGDGKNILVNECFADYNIGSMRLTSAEEFHVESMRVGKLENIFA